MDDYDTLESMAERLGISEVLKLLALVTHPVVEDMTSDRIATKQKEISYRENTKQSKAAR